jgi:hypothetical protein
VKIRHKINHGWAPDHTDAAWAEKVEREATRTTDATERAYLKAQTRLAQAERKATTETAKPHADKKRVKVLWRRVEQRRDELVALQYQMQSSPAGSQHRGTPSHRGVATGNPL